MFFFFFTNHASDITLLEIQHQTFAPLCENMVCKGRSDHRQVP